MRLSDEVQLRQLAAGGPGSGRHPSGGLHDTLAKHGWKSTKIAKDANFTTTHYKHSALTDHHASVKDWKGGSQSFSHSSPEHESGTHTSSSSPSFVDNYLSGLK